MQWGGVEQILQRFSKICPKFASTSILLASADTVDVNSMDYIILNYEYRRDTFLGFPCGAVSCSICPPLRMGIKFWNGQYNIFKNTTYPQKEISFQTSKTEINNFRLLNIFLFILLLFYFPFPSSAFGWSVLGEGGLMPKVFWRKWYMTPSLPSQHDLWNANVALDQTLKPRLGSVPRKDRLRYKSTETSPHFFSSTFSTKCQISSRWIFVTSFLCLSKSVGICNKPSSFETTKLLKCSTQL